MSHGSRHLPIFILLLQFELQLKLNLLHDLELLESLFIVESKVFEIYFVSARKWVAALLTVIQRRHFLVRLPACLIYFAPLRLSDQIVQMVFLETSLHFSLSLQLLVKQQNRLDVTLKTLVKHFIPTSHRCYPLVVVEVPAV